MGCDDCGVSSVLSSLLLGSDHRQPVLKKIPNLLPQLIRCQPQRAGTHKAEAYDHIASSTLVIIDSKVSMKSATVATLTSPRSQLRPLPPPFFFFSLFFLECFFCLHRLRPTAPIAPIAPTGNKCPGHTRRTPVSFRRLTL